METYTLSNRRAGIALAQHVITAEVFGTHPLSNHGAEIALATCNHGGAIWGMGTYDLASRSARVALATDNRSEVIQGVGAYSLSNRGTGIASATCNHGGVIRGMGTHKLSSRGSSVALVTYITVWLLEGWELTGYRYPAVVPGSYQ